MNQVLITLLPEIMQGAKEASQLSVKYQEKNLLERVLLLA
jgi:hypothetical protein